jgi:hypothetical protein
MCMRTEHGQLHAVTGSVCKRDCAWACGRTCARACSVIAIIASNPSRGRQNKGSADDLRQFIRKQGIFIGLQGCTDKVAGRPFFFFIAQASWGRTVQGR